MAEVRSAQRPLVSSNCRGRQHDPRVHPDSQIGWRMLLVDPLKACRRDGAPITIAGLRDEWRDRETGETIRSCAMIITEANQFVGELHDRMRVMSAPRGDRRGASAVFLFRRTNENKLRVMSTITV